MSTVLLIIMAEVIFALLWVLWFRKFFSFCGSTKKEREMVMPEDSLLGNKFIDMCHSITIDAPRENVFKWIKQMGQGRGGYYSYERLERFCGFGIHNRYDIDPELQKIKEGDWIRLHKNGWGTTLLTLEENKKFVMHFDSRQEEKPLPPGAKMLNVPFVDWCAGWWSFTLFEQPDGKTRLVERWQIDWDAKNPIMNFLILHLAELPSTIMEFRMMREIKMLSEGRSPSEMGIF